jgi:hypothetical protein
VLLSQRINREPDGKEAFYLPFASMGLIEIAAKAVF